MSRIFLVDDHPLVRDGLRAMLESAGHEVVGEADAPTPALAGLVQLKPDILLLDLGLGDRSGLEILEAMNQRALPTRVIVASMSRRPQDMAQALRMGAYGYVLKDSRRADLLATVDAVANGQRHLGLEEADLALLGLSVQAAAAAPLTQRERQVLAMVARGRTSAAIGDALSLSPKTVEGYRRRSMAKLGLSDVPSVVRWAIREGLVEP